MVNKFKRFLVLSESLRENSHVANKPQIEDQEKKLNYYKAIQMLKQQTDDSEHLWSVCVTAPDATNTLLPDETNQESETKQRKFEIPSMRESATSFKTVDFKYDPSNTYRQSECTSNDLCVSP
uniref:Uncharacterized protein n=1 Tax=Ciona intestinalis TaxID=7719 RepID=F6WJN4_CIOIN